MRESLNIPSLKNKAKELMAGKYYSAIMTLLLYYMLRVVLTNFSTGVALEVAQLLERMTGGSISEPMLITASCLVTFLAGCLYSVMDLGICYYYLNIISDNYYNSFDLFYGFRNHFGKSFVLSGIMTAVSFLAFLPGNMIYYLLRTRDILPTDLVLGLAGLQAILLLAYIPISLMLSQVYYLVLDYPELTVSQLLSRSCRLMKGRKRELFILQLHFLPLLLLLIPTMGLGCFWVIPYLNTAYALYYLEIMQNP